MIRIREINKNNEVSEAGPKKLKAVDTDMDLISKFKLGDKSAFEELYFKYKQKIYCLCLRLLESPDQAEDFTQEVFIKAIEKINQFRGDAKFDTWLHSIARNLIFMHFRTNEHKKRNNFLSIEDMYFSYSIPDNFKTFYKPDDGMDIEDAIKKLPEGYKNVLILHDIFGYDHKDIAKTLGCSDGTSKSQLHKSRLKMRDLLNKKSDPKIIGYNRTLV